MNAQFITALLLGAAVLGLGLVLAAARVTS